MGTQQYLQLIILAIFIGVSGLTWLYRQLKEQAATKRAEDARRRREEEILRTGRDPLRAPPTPEAREEQRRIDAVVARRESELQELRRRQAGARPTGSGEPPGILIQIPGTAGPIVVKPVPRPRPGPAPTRAEAPMPQPRPGRQGRQRPPGAQRQTRKPAPRPSEPQPSPLVERSELMPTEPAQPAPAPSLVRALAAAPQTPDEWRRAIVLREVLAPPLGLRPPL